MLEESFRAFRKALGLFIIEERSVNIQRVFERCYRHTQDYEKLKTLIPDKATRHVSFAQFLAGKGRWEEGEKELERALELEPNNPTILAAQQRFLNDRKSHNAPDAENSLPPSP